MCSFDYYSTLIILLGLSASVCTGNDPSTTTTKHPHTLVDSKEGAKRVEDRPFTKEELEKAKKMKDVKSSNGSKFDLSAVEKDHNGTQFSVGQSMPFILWNGGHVPYVLSPTLPGNFRYAISIAMERFGSSSCIHFVPRTYEPQYVNFIFGQNCRTYMDPYRPEQVIQLGGPCDSAALIMHLIGHLLGMTHEHQRVDRDGYVQVFLQNIEPKSMNNYLRFPSPLQSFGQLRYPYDSMSIMHYPSWFGTIGGRGLAMTLLNGGQINQAEFLSHFDIHKLRDAHCHHHHR